MPLTDNEIRQHITDSLTDQQIVDLYANDKRTVRDIPASTFKKVLRDGEYVFQDVINGGLAGSLHTKVVTDGTNDDKKKYAILIQRLEDNQTIDSAQTSAVGTFLLRLVQLMADAAFQAAMVGLTGGFRYSDVNLAYVTARRAEILSSDSRNAYIVAIEDKANSAATLFRARWQAALPTQWDAAERAAQWTQAWSDS